MYIGPKSRTERTRKTKIGTQVAHITCDSDTTFKVKRSKVKVIRPLYSPRVNASASCSGERGNVLSVGTYCYIVVCRRGGRLGGARRFGARRGRRGAGHIVAAARLQLVEAGLSCRLPNHSTEGCDMTDGTKKSNKNDEHHVLTSCAVHRALRDIDL